MAKQITVEIKQADLDRFYKDINRYSTKAKKGISRALVTTANAVTSKARSMAPRNTSVLAGSYFLIQHSKYEVEIGTNVKYAPYQEFGTGQNVKFYRYFDNIPFLKGLRQYAMSFKTTGKGRLMPKSHFFKALFLERKNFENKIQKALKDG